MTAPTIEKAAPIPADDLVDAVAKAISRHGYTEQVKGDGFAWWWNSLHDHPGNVFAHECREDDRAKARLALQVIMQDRASQEERIREDEPGYLVRIAFRDGRSGGLRITSPDVPGLILSHHDEPAILSDMVEVLREADRARLRGGAS